MIAEDAVAGVCASKCRHEHAYFARLSGTYSIKSSRTSSLHLRCCYTGGEQRLKGVYFLKV